MAVRLITELPGFSSVISTNTFIVGSSTLLKCSRGTLLALPFVVLWKNYIFSCLFLCLYILFYILIMLCNLKKNCSVCIDICMI